MRDFSHHGANETLMRKLNVENSPTFVTVVAAAIMDATGRLLLQQCPAHKRHAGLWEFPGGKVESMEIPRLALCREILEELDLELDPDALTTAGFAEELPAEGRAGLVLLLYTCRTWLGIPTGIEGQSWGWFTPEEAAALDLPPMDRALLAGLSA
jgi:8-oxo-dGTP diphosphatase